MGTGRLDSLPARSAATGPVTATAPVDDVQQDSATGTEALRVGRHLYLMDLLSLTSCRAIWGGIGQSRLGFADGRQLRWEDRGAMGSGTDRDLPRQDSVRILRVGTQ